MTIETARYVLFAGDDYYPAGGWGDFLTRGDNLEALKRTAAAVLELGRGHLEGGKDWAHIVDLTTGKTWINNYHESGRLIKGVTEDTEALTWAEIYLSNPRTPDFWEKLAGK